MGRNKKKSGNAQSVGSLIIKDRFASKGQHRSADSFLHTSELQDGYEWGRLQNLQSVTEQNQLDDFLATAELAGTEFTAEKLNVEIVAGPTAATGIPSESDMVRITEAQEKYKQQLRIPRRPNWHGGMSAEELQSLERQDFLEWRRSLAELQDVENITITPFEKNLDFWRQLWRVIERSHVVVQIVDSRNPLLFRCEDLEAYVREVEETKVNVILINKSDFLTDHQRQYWCDYFNKSGVRILFWSAKLEAEKVEDEAEKGEDEAEKHYKEKVGDETEKVEDEAEKGEDEAEQAKMEATDNISAPLQAADEFTNTSTLHSASELIGQLQSLRPASLEPGKEFTIGFVGYPNVGKSSTINALLQAKQCPVSATPGRTKHFQTHIIDNNTVLCDCPGLVMPSFVTTKAEMILNGILPIDQMRDHRPAINGLAHKIPRRSLEATYGISIRKPKEGEEANRPPTDLELLNAYGAMRGFMTSSGVPDCPRSARILLKDYFNGKLLFCEAPPGVSKEEYVCTPAVPSRISQTACQLDVISESIDDIDIEIDKSASRKLDKEFFSQNSSTVHTKGKRASKDSHLSKKHGNRNKREKTRRLYSHLDQHDNY